MTTREQLKLMDAIRKKNDASIAKYIEQMRVEAASHTTEQTAKEFSTDAEVEFEIARLLSETR